MNSTESRLPIVQWDEWEAIGSLVPCITIDVNGQPWEWDGSTLRAGTEPT